MGVIIRSIMFSVCGTTKVYRTDLIMCGCFGDKRTCIYCVSYCFYCGFLYCFVYVYLALFVLSVLVTSD